MSFKYYFFKIISNQTTVYQLINDTNINIFFIIANKKNKIVLNNLFIAIIRYISV